MAHRPTVKTQGLASFGVGPGIASRGCDLPAPDIWLPLPALISPQRGVLSDPFNSSSSIITCKVVILNQYTYNLFLQVLTFPPPTVTTLTSIKTYTAFKQHYICALRRLYDHGNTGTDKQVHLTKALQLQVNDLTQRLENVSTTTDSQY